MSNGFDINNISSQFVYKRETLKSWRFASAPRKTTAANHSFIQSTWYFLYKVQSAGQESKSCLWILREPYGYHCQSPWQILCRSLDMFFVFYLEYFTWNTYLFDTTPIFTYRPIVDTNKRIYKQSNAFKIKDVKIYDVSKTLRYTSKKRLASSVAEHFISPKFEGTNGGQRFLRAGKIC